MKRFGIGLHIAAAAIGVSALALVIVGVGVQKVGGADLVPASWWVDGGNGDRDETTRRWAVSHTPPPGMLVDPVWPSRSTYQGPDRW